MRLVSGVKIFYTRKGESYGLDLDTREMFERIWARAWNPIVGDTKVCFPWDGDENT